MKTLILLLIIPIFATSQNIKKNFWIKQSASAGSMMVAGWLHGTNEVAVHDYRRYAARHPNANPQWSKPGISFRNKYKNWPTDMRAKYWGSKTVLAWTTDAYHLRNTLRNALIAGNVAITLTLYQKPNWKHIVLQAVGSWACYAVGSGAAHWYYKKVD